jgi:hypothetical protein
MEIALGQRHQACVEPVGDIDVVVGQHRAHGVAQQRGMVAGQRRHQQDLRVIEGCRALEAQQPAEGFLGDDFLADRNGLAVDHRMVQAEFRLLVAPRDAGQQFRTGGNAAAAGQIGEGAEGAGKELLAGFRPEAQGRSGGVLQFVQCVDHLWPNLGNKADACLHFTRLRSNVHDPNGVFRRANRAADSRRDDIGQSGLCERHAGSV